MSERVFQWVDRWWLVLFGSLALVWLFAQYMAITTGQAEKARVEQRLHALEARCK